VNAYDATPGTTGPVPPAADGRIGELDSFRAFALLGILLVNIWFFADPWVLLPQGSSPDFTSGVDIAARAVATGLFEFKFYILFSFLFGYSFVIQWASAVRQQQPPAPRLLRRSAGLVVLGVLHGVFLWFGDILAVYGLFALILIATWNIRPRTAVIAGAVITGAIAVLVILLGLLVLAVGGVTDLAEQGVTAFPGVEEIAGTPLSALQANISNYLLNGLNVLLTQGPLALGMFYFGVAAAKVRFFERGVSPALIRKVLYWALPVGLAGGVLHGYVSRVAASTEAQFLDIGLTLLTAPLLTCGYLALLLLLFRTRPGSRVKAALEPAGRMALSNYVGQSVFMAVIFTGYGFGLTNRIPPLGVIAVGLAIFVLQLALSAAWLKRFRYGPLEWLLRSVTYGKVQRLSLQS
jgi:uncharacterized protein